MRDEIKATMREARERARVVLLEALRVRTREAIERARLVLEDYRRARELGEAMLVVQGRIES